MKSEQFTFSQTNAPIQFSPHLFEAQLVLVAGGIDVVGDPGVYKYTRELYPNADIVSFSTAGEIYGTEVLDQSIVVTALEFEKTTIEAKVFQLDEFKNSEEAGAAIGQYFQRKDLVHILVISDGINANGDALVRGINASISDNIIVTGGLAADGGRFQKTLTGLNSVPQPNQIIAIGFYSKDLVVKHGSFGGWDAFGPTRLVTSSEGNVLYSLDDVNALSLYKKFLGDKANELPGSALLFPLSIQKENGKVLVRTILGVDEEAGSMTFAGDIPQGSTVQFMMANFDRLIDGAHVAAELSKTDEEPTWAFLVSCVGRKIVLNQRTDEELESVAEVLGENVTINGFYSNGEISPLHGTTKCALHNQTMTVTTYFER